MTDTTERRVFRLMRRPSGELGDGDLVLSREALADILDDEVRIRTLLLSIDPSNRIWMSDADQYMPPVAIGAPMRGVTLAVIEESRSSKFSPGDIVTPLDGEWASHQVLPASRLARARPREGIPLSALMSIFGPPGLTAHVGMVEIAGVKEGETVTVSAAAGAVGSVAGQIAKARGCRVIGIAGGPEKCAWLTDELGFDAAIDYKRYDVGTELARLAPDGIHAHFENVGGAILDAAIANMAEGGRIALCGLVSTYNEGGPVPGPREFQRVLMHRLTIRGFIVLDHFARAREAFAEIEELARSGRLKWRDHIVEGLENAPDALSLLFAGKNSGKLMVRVSDR